MPGLDDFDPKSLLGGAAAARRERGGPPHHSIYGDRGKPTCNNCRSDSHNRCPTAITNHGRSGWASDFDCACYDRDADMHASLVEADDEEHEANRESHFGRLDWDTEGRQAWDSVDGKFDW